MPRKSPRPSPVLRLGGALALVLLAPACRDVDALVPVLAPTSYCAPRRVETVACTLDGDTVDVGACGDEQGERLRFLGVAAPEIEHPPEPEECWGDEASDYVDERLTGRQVRLEFDQECLDLYGRTLAWLWVEGDDGDPLWDELADLEMDGVDLDNGTFAVLFNELVIRTGQARRYDEGFAQDVRYYERLGLAEEMAAVEGRGLWAECAD